MLHVYGPVKSWRQGLSLGIDPIGSQSTCSFNCVYCQLGNIQNISNEIKIYVPTQTIIDDLIFCENTFNYTDLDVITFAGSGEPSLAANLGDIIDAIRDKYKNSSKRVPISVLTNSTMLGHKGVRERLLKADFISLKLDAVDDKSLKSINQVHSEINFAQIISGIKILKQENEYSVLQLQIMILPKYVQQKAYIDKLAQVILDTGVYRIQLNTPSRARPLNPKGEYWIETRSNHYEADSSPVQFRQLPVIDSSQAFVIEERLQQLCDYKLDIVNIYKR